MTDETIEDTSDNNLDKQHTAHVHGEMKAWLIFYCSVAILLFGDSFTIDPNTRSRRCMTVRKDPFASNDALSFSSSSSRAVSRLYASEDNLDNAGERQEHSSPDETKQRKKEEIAKAAAQIIKRSDNDEDESTTLFNLNPFRAGQNLRKSFDSALSSLARASSTLEDRQKSPYYLDDRFQESGGALFTQESNPYLARLQEEKYIPEVLVVGATGEVGRLVVRRLLLEGRSRVRVLVRDLYSKTLNMLGTGVVYCQGDLNNMDSLEYALTDVDKIVVCAAAPRPDEEGFKEKFLGFAEDNLDGNETVLGEIKSSQQHNTKGSKSKVEDENDADVEWERLESVMEVRARLAEQVDFIGMQNLVKAYQNVRHADYGTSQAAKRSLFKFQSRPDDFNLFAIDDSENEVAHSDTTGPNNAYNEQKSSSGYKPTMQSTRPKRSLSISAADNPDEYNEYADEYEKYADDFDSYDDEYALDPTSAKLIESRQDTSVKTQVQWIRNEFGHGVFVGKLPKAAASGLGGETSIVSSRLRSRDGGPEDGIDLGGFGGIVCRVCSDGGNYEAFIRTGAFEEGIEYVCGFSTASKTPRRGNASRNKFTTIRLPFQKFIPVRRRTSPVDDSDRSIPPFRGNDVRHIGFRFRSSSNSGTIRPKRKENEMCSFYLGKDHQSVAAGSNPRENGTKYVEWPLRFLTHFHLVPTIRLVIPQAISNATRT